MTPQGHKPPDPAPQPSSAAGEKETLAAIARSEFVNRRRRDSLIGGGLFAEPAWDMLLELYVEHQRGRAVAVDPFIARAAVAATTALRWVGVLIDSGLVIQIGDQSRGPGPQIGLSDLGVEEMERYLRDLLHRVRPCRDIAGGDPP